MKVTKFGHCCLLVEEKEARILTDPGAYSSAQNSLEKLDVILISHEHPDHLHIESLIKVLKNNPQAKVFSNKSVGELLKKENILFEVLKKNNEVLVKGVEILAFNAPHEFIADSVVLPENIAFFIGGKLFYPGDSFFVPERNVEILALPVAGPWMKLCEAIDYAKKVNPKKAFPVHDGMLKIIGPAHRVPKQELGEAGIDFLSLEAGQSAEF